MLFLTRFLFNNLLIALFIPLLSGVKRLLKNQLSARAQYRLWFLLPFLLAIPFFPALPGTIGNLSRIRELVQPFEAQGAKGTPGAALPLNHSSYETASDWMNDFALSVTRETNTPLLYLLLALWLVGILLTLLYLLRCKIRLYRLKQSALPLQNPDILAIYDTCRQQCKIKKTVPIYSTAFIQSPITTGFLRPCIYLPMHLIADSDEKSMRYILLHELQHIRHQDGLVSVVMNLSLALYWFHPLVRYGLHRMRSDRETACDSSVLKLLSKTEYTSYGMTLLSLAEKISRPAIYFGPSMMDSKKQLAGRILNIAAFRSETPRMRRKGRIVFFLLGFVFMETSGLLLPSANAASNNYVSQLSPGSQGIWPQDALNTGSERLPFGFSPYTAGRLKDNGAAAPQTLDLAPFFKGYDGCFVSYRLNSGDWQVYQEERALEQVSPNSTYKIYSALLALEQQYILPDQSLMQWDGTNTSIPQWNQDQTLNTALKNSVNWYFQNLDERSGQRVLQSFYEKIGYGNQDLSAGSETFWMESSLKISAVEQVALLKRLYENDLPVSAENKQAVLEAMQLTTSERGTLYGKTGTGRVNGENVNGWFIGFVEAENDTCFFAVNIRGAFDADGTSASEIALNILDDLGVF